VKVSRSLTIAEEITFVYSPLPFSSHNTIRPTRSSTTARIHAEESTAKMEGNNQKTQISSEEVAAASIDSSAVSVSAAASASTDGVQAGTTTSSNMTAQDWADREAEHIQRTGPPGYYYLRALERVEAKALKDAEVRRSFRYYSTHLG
jgi:hypothetical protein